MLGCKGGSGGEAKALSARRRERCSRERVPAEARVAGLWEPPRLPGTWPPVEDKGQVVLPSPGLGKVRTVPKMRGSWGAGDGAPSALEVAFMCFCS